MSVYKTNVELEKSIHLSVIYYMDLSKQFEREQK